MRVFTFSAIVGLLLSLGGAIASAQEVPPDKPTKGECLGACADADQKCGAECPTKGKGAVRACLGKCKAQTKACKAKCK